MTSRLDYCNGLLCGITDELLCRPKKVQNNAARVVTGSKGYDHITLVLKDFHWLPIRKRIEDSAFDFQMHARMCPSILERTVSQTSQYKDSKIKH